MLPLGHEVLDDDRDQVVVEVRAGLGRAAAGVLAEQSHDEVADGEAVRTGGRRVESGAGQASSVLASLRCRIAREKEGDGEVRRATGLAPCCSGAVRTFSLLRIGQPVRVAGWHRAELDRARAVV